MIGFLRVFLPVYWTFYIGFAYVLPLRTLKRRYGIRAEAVRNPDPVMQVGERCRNIIFVAVLAIVAAHSLHPPLLDHLGRLPALESAPVRVAGVAFLLLALALIRVGQTHLGRSWRVGFDPEEEAEELIVNGVYRWTRNPIYVGMGISAVAFFLVLPNTVTFAIANVALVLLVTRVHVEERWLLSAHGDHYRAYCQCTPRWFPKLSRLPRLTEPARSPAEPAPPR